MSLITTKGKKVKLNSIIEDFETVKSAYQTLKEETTFEEVKVYHEFLKGLLDEFSEVYIEYELMQKKDPDVDSERYNLFKKEAILIILDLSINMENLQKEQLTVIEHQKNIKFSKPQQSSSVVRKIRLPEIKLPEFNVDFNNWLSFKDTYVSMIHSNPAFSDIDKFHYLKSSVKIQPESQNVLNNYQFSGDSYESAWEALCRRFDDRRLLLMQYTNSLMTVKGSADDSLTEARRVLDYYISHRAAFNMMKVTNDELLDMIFEQFVRNRFDATLMREWDIHIDSSTKKPSWDEFCKFMDQRIKSLKFTDREGNSFPLNSSSSISSMSKDRSTELMVNKSKNPQIEKCKLCSRNHQIYKCDIFNGETPNERYKVAMKFKLCINCLSAKHNKYGCKSVLRCKICGMKHHTSLHNSESINSIPNVENNS